ncbi:MAG: AAA family ATPase [Lachnospiraceae bacterium]|nr:AAA family ATPase [Lachnospiraceae bacterium]MBS5130752.1 AAA family ATPase [Lachnospiraceae bacterium]
MTSTITKIRLINFRRFSDYTVTPNERINILVGDNEVGKSSILEAIDLVASGNMRRVESIGLDRLINIEAVKEFNSGRRTFENLPVLRIELYLSGDSFDFTMCGKNNTAGIECDGIRLVCEPNPDYRAEIASVLSTELSYFPYDYYSIRFSTFADEGYTGYKKKIRSILIDSSAMNSEYATTDFVRRMYMRYTEQDVKERANHKSSYRQMRTNFQTDSLKTLNEQVPVDKHYTFGLKSGSAAEFESDLMIYEDEIGIDSKGTGKQIFIKTDFALEHSGENVDVILVEEPENHLSPVNLRKLIQRISDTQSGQLFITTHNSLISTRLELKNLLIMHINGTDKPIMLKDLSDNTAKYFMKAPPASIIEFALAKKAILVEGPSEYMLMEKFYEECTECSPESDGTHIIDVRGLSFKRYLDIAKLTGCKVAVMTDNDKDYQKHCVDKYKDYASDTNIAIFFETDNTKRTFEIVLYGDNSALCDTLFDSPASDYMLNNKTEAAYALLSQENQIVVPNYIKRGIEWIRE